MKASIFFVVTAMLVSFGMTAAAAEHAGKGHGPCQQIVKICEDAGFVKGEAKQGYGLWVDCIDPIMQGKTTVPGAVKPLPAVDPNLVSECKAKNPKFGSGHVGTKQ
jgi:hypothetical protein